MGISNGMGETLCLKGTPNLEHCHLLGDLSGNGELIINSSSFECCTGLAYLTLHSQRFLALHHDCFAALSALTSLTLADCGLRAVPSALATLSSLQCLNLCSNAALMIDEAGVAVLRALKELRELDVTTSVSRLVYGSNVQALFALVESLRDEGVRLHVNFDPDQSEPYQQETAYWGHMPTS